MSKLASVCIICLENDHNLKKIFETDDINIKILDKLKFCFNDVVYDDNHCMICTKCSYELQRSFEFKKMFEANRDRLFIYLSQLDIQSPTENCEHMHIHDKNQKHNPAKQKIFNVALVKNDKNTEGVNATADCVIHEEVDIKNEPSEFAENFSVNEEKIPEEIFTEEQTQFSVEWLKDDIKLHSSVAKIMMKCPGVEIPRTCLSIDLDPFVSLEVNHEILRVFERNPEEEENDEGHTGIHAQETEVVNTQNVQEEEKLKGFTGYTNALTSICVICDESFSLWKYITELEKSDIEAGQKQKPPVDQDGYMCHICYRGFEYKHHLKKHMVVHSRPASNFCPQCNKKFKSSTYLKHHMIMHSGVRAYSCTECPKKFWQIGSLNKHLSSHTKPFRCEICNKHFSQNSTLKSHMVLHSGTKDFTCNVCDKQFMHKTNLTQHMVTHSDEMPFSCNQCHKKFKLRNNLKLHVSAVHMKIKRYSCIECHKKFNRSNNLKRHMTVHTGEKPYTCKKCQRSFNLYGNMKRHMAVHTNETPFCCQFCPKKFKYHCTLKKHMIVHRNCTDSCSTVNNL